MGNQPTASYHVGQLVVARFDAGKQYYAAKIVRKHSPFAYDVQFFHSGRIRTVQWDDIKPDMGSPRDHRLSTAGNDNFEIKSKNNQLDIWKKLESDNGSGIVFDLKHNSSRVKHIRNKEKSSDTIESEKEKDENENENENKDPIENDFFTNFDQLLTKYKTIEIKLDNINEDQDKDNNECKDSKDDNNNNKHNKVGGEMVENFNNLIAKVGGKKIRETLVHCYENKAQERMIKVFKQSKCSNVSKLLELTINDEMSDMNQLSFDLRMDLNYNSTMKTHLNINNKERRENEMQFKNNIRKEISDTLKIDESLIVIDDIKAGSVIVTVIIVSGIVALVLAGLFVLKRLFFTSSKKQNINNKDIEANNDDCNNGETFWCKPGDEIRVKYSNKIHKAKVLEVRQKVGKDTTIKIEYMDKPFRFRNTEVLAMNSDRIDGYCEPKNQIYGFLNTSDEPGPGCYTAIKVGLLDCLKI